MKSSRLMKLSAAAVVAASLAGAALAQGGPGRMMQERGGGMGWGMWGNDGPAGAWEWACGAAVPGAEVRTGCSTASRGGWPS